ncbi:hypothetical protein, partial [Pontimonas sp.]
LVQWAVNDFAHALGVELKQTERTENHSYNRYPSWFFVKTSESTARVYEPHPELVRVATEEKLRIARHRLAKTRKRARKNLARKLLGRR